ncbi:MAG: M48 family metallopeptidase [Anaerobiospirillum succiniciproducens]|uniref:M48 family metallopeptidase n=1 Tax=Anaerobiospirillum succiniciproducens TaxID=13335 RepID=UPI0023551B49|nr:M48 family metallopeptidase [Anaerobiospirillum succiniciproducens]MCI6864322.1 M48 family metallopeptidase [Anaerobiospirillum succiniciproducens]MDY2798281.1 M48 family metallopeptidase [Anaerobiospirillum succiniciproducens]
MAKKSVLSALAMALTLAVSAPALSGCNSTTSNSVTTDRTQIMLVSEQEVMAEADKYYQNILAEAKRTKTLNTNKQTYNRVRKIADKMIKIAPTFRADCKDWKWEVNVFTSDEVNAWCAAGGKIGVYTGIIDTLKLTDDELATVLSHEIAHALREHSREQMSAEYAKQTALSVASFLGVETQKLQLADIVSQVGLSLPFSRSHETEADELGLELMYRAGYNIDAAPKLWEKMIALSGSSNGLTNLLSTHPSGEDRIENLTRVAAELKGSKTDAKK